MVILLMSFVLLWHGFKPQVISSLFAVNLL